MKKTLKEFLEKCSEEYEKGTPIISDEEYDYLERLLGDNIINGSGDVKHRFRLYSLKKHYDKDGEPPLDVRMCVKTPKLDGLAISLLYVNGKLEMALTRGNGILGKTISMDKVKSLNIPLSINTQHPLAQISGEVVARADVDNSRNFCAGAVNTKDYNVWIERVKEGQIKFVAYNIQVVENRWGLFNEYKTDLEYLRANGFTTVDTFNHADYPKDGIVYRLNDTSLFNAKGFTDKFPRGAYAHKQETEGEVTTLLDVQWQTGKSGKVTPVAILEPIELGGAVVSKATLNNIEYIETLGLYIGCKVLVVRSGEIIPKIVGIIDDESSPLSKNKI
jgi:DNA ligase (NAD+)